MAIQPKEVLKYIASLAFGGLILYFVYRNQDMGQVYEEFSRANFYWILVSVMVGFLANYIRAIRWKQLLEPLGYHPSTPTILSATMGAYLANFVFPRMGEIVRCGMLNRSDKVPVNVSIGSVIAERLIDLVGLVVVTLLAVFFEFSRLQSFFIDLLNGLGAKLFQPFTLVALAVALLCAVALFLWLRKRNARKSTEKNNKLADFIKGLIEGLISLKDIKNLPLFVFYSIAIWVLYFLATYVLFKSIPSTMELSPLAGLSVLVMGAAGMAAPVQGGIGAYHIMVSQCLLLYGISETDGKIFAGLAHTTTSLGLIVTGAITVIVVQLFFTSKNKHASKG